MLQDASGQDADADAEDLLRRALIDPDAAAAVSLRIDGLGLAQTLTVIFNGRRDLGTVETFVAHGERGAGSAIKAEELLRVPCDLDLHDAHDRSEASELYAAQAQALRDALLAADTMLGVWLTALQESEAVGVDRRVGLSVAFPAHRLMPIALVAPDRGLTVAPVCGARTLAEGRPPLGIALAQQDVAHVYPLREDPDECLEDFAGRTARHAERLSEQLERQERSVARFLELSLPEDLPLL